MTGWPEDEEKDHQLISWVNKRVTEERALQVALSFGSKVGVKEDRRAKYTYKDFRRAFKSWITEDRVRPGSQSSSGAIGPFVEPREDDF